MTHASVHKVDNLVHPERPWVVRWRTPSMPGLAFWYFETEAEAHSVAAQILGHRLTA